MKWSDLDALLDCQEKVTAPSDLTANVMKAVSQMEIRKKPDAPAAYRTGVRLIAAASIALIVNFSPLLEHVTRLTHVDAVSYQRLDLESLPEAIDYYTLKVSNFITRPFRKINQSLNKEE